MGFTLGARDFKGVQCVCVTYSQYRYGEYTEDNTSVTLRESGADYGGGSEVIVLSYQKVTGPLMANSHPGSYCGQDVYSDMLIVGDENERTILHGNRTSKCGDYAGGVRH